MSTNMPNYKTRGGDRDGRGRGIGRVMGRGVQPDEAQAVRVVRIGRTRTRGPRTRERGAPIERSQMYVGAIVMSEQLSTSTVIPGKPLEVPVTIKQSLSSVSASGKHKLVHNVQNPAPKCIVVSEQLSTSTATPGDALEVLMTVKRSPSSDSASGKRKLLHDVLDPALEYIVVSEPLSTSMVTPAEPLEAPMTVKRSPSSEYESRKRKLDVLNPALEDIVYNGSDVESDGGIDDVNSPMFLVDRVFDYIVAEDVALKVDSQPMPSAQASGPTSDSSGSFAFEGVRYGPNIADFEWAPLPQPAIPPHHRREPFTARVGPVSKFSSPYDAFVSIWDRSIMEYIAAETNRYAEQTLEAALLRGDLGGYSRTLTFKPVDADELYIYFALCLATGLVVKADLTEYWSVNNDILDTPNFSRFMVYNRFITISRMLHFINNADDISHLSPNDAKIAKLAPIIEHLNKKFQMHYQLGQSVSLDESLTQCKGWLGINQIIKNNAASKGIRTYEVCDSRSGYLWRFKVHSGRQTESSEVGYLTSLVLDLLKGLENKGHTVFMDNFYNSPVLARLLKSRGFDCVGTVSLNRQHVPADLKEAVKNPMAVGSILGATSGDVDVMVWKDRNIVAMISTYHGAACVSRDGKVKPTVVHDYHVRMGGVDKKDQMLAAYPIERKRTAVWYKKFFRRLLNVSILNAFILYKESAPLEEHRKVKHRQFRKTLLQELLAKHYKVVSMQPSQLSPSAKTVKFSSEMVRHFPTEFPYVEKLKQRKRGTCSVCRKRSTIQCISCNVALCLSPCFVKYHS